MDNIIGHDKTKQQIQIAIASATARNESIPHVLFSGLAGAGKTTFAMSLAKAASLDFLPVSPDDITDMSAVLKTLDKLNHDGYDRYGNRRGLLHPTIIYFDEIHRMPRKGQEILGIAMEKFQIESGKPNKFFWIPYFTIIGATTDDGELTKPFREKFKLRFLFEVYSDDDMLKIVRFHAVRMSVNITDAAAREVVKRARGVPRYAVNYVERLRDYAIYIDANVVTSNAAHTMFEALGIDNKGLTPTELKVLKILYSVRDPIGLDNLAIITNESMNNIKNTIEPHLIQKGLIFRSGRGRIITDEGRKHLESTGYAGRVIDKAEINADYVRS
jgi:Holliday junction DNA helicase RuvB